MAYNDKLYRNYLKNAERERALWENLARQKRLNDAKEKGLDQKEWKILRKLSMQKWKGDAADNPEFVKNHKEISAAHIRGGELGDRLSKHASNERKWRKLAAKEWGKRTDLAKKVAEPATKIVNAVGKSLNAVGKSLKGKTR